MVSDVEHSPPQEMTLDTSESWFNISKDFVQDRLVSQIAKPSSKLEGTAATNPESEALNTVDS